MISLRVASFECSSPLHPIAARSDPWWRWVSPVIMLWSCGTAARVAVGHQADANGERMEGVEWTVNGCLLVGWWMLISFNCLDTFGAWVLQLLGIVGCFWATSLDIPKQKDNGRGSPKTIIHWINSVWNRQKATHCYGLLRCIHKSNVVGASLSTWESFDTG